MPLVLHDNALSSNAQKVRFLLAELGQTAELREVPFAHPRPDWHLAVNPLGGIPAIVWDGFPLAESNTVLRFIATRSGDTQHLPLRPPRSRDRQLAARRDRDVPASRALPDRGGRVRAARRPRARRRGARSRGRRRRRSPRRCRSSRPSRACSTTPRRGPAAAASRSRTSRRRRCCTACGAAASRWTPSRASSRGPRPAASAPPGRPWRRRRASSQTQREDLLGRTPHGGEHELLRHPRPLEAEQEGSSRRGARRARAPGGRRSPAPRR